MEDTIKEKVLNSVLSVIKEHKVYPLFLAVSGSHMWNLNRPDSDIDVRGVYVKPTNKILSLNPGRDTIESLNVDGIIDIQLYEVKKAFNMLFNNNGNLIELFLSPIQIFNRDLNWRFIGSSFITKQLKFYYKGYYHSQRKRAATNRGGKALVYTYREIFQGIWLMKHGELIYDFHELKRLIEENYFYSELLDDILKPENWGRKLDVEEIALFALDWMRLEDILEHEFLNSKLPEIPEVTKDVVDRTLLFLRNRYKEWDCNYFNNY